MSTQITYLNHSGFSVETDSRFWSLITTKIRRERSRLTARYGGNRSGFSSPTGMTTTLTAALPTSTAISTSSMKTFL